MRRIVVIHQPEFFPYIGFFHRLLTGDLLVILDHVQYTRRNFQNRNKIKTPKGEKWITASIVKDDRNTPINQILLSTDVDWRNNHINLIRENYKEAPYFDELFPIIKKLYDCKCEKLVDFNMKVIEKFNHLFSIKTEMIFSSTLGSRGKKNELLVDILKKVAGTAYLSGDGAKKYYDPSIFKKANIEVVWQNFTHPIYPQINGEFIPYLSSMDLLFNCGIEKSKEILRSI